MKPSKPAETNKAKAAKQPDSSAGDNSAPSLASGQQGVQPVKAVDDEAKKNSGESDDQSSDPQAAVERIEGEEGDPSQTPNASVEGAGAPKPLSSGLKLGGSVGLHAGRTVVDRVATDSAASTDPSEAATVDAAASDAASDPGVPATAASVIGSSDLGTGAAHAAHRDFSDALASAQGQTPAAEQSGTSPAQTVAKAPPPLPPEVRFADANQAKIVSSVHTQLLPNGGSMQIRLDPPELGSMNISVRMRDGVMTATFETSTDQAAAIAQPQPRAA